ncbi:hypothetical protein JVT61DRAFT_15193 [Boletus reticuloceps]|uniref:Uncharacterized protein n=1 Tax=Boletus reticuloceps TaxID=495285 RepID=A0A8I2YSD3_9AGAM|nr:hypothetical protein JVT61DRAFT_15193 [Boletus reticuloceps]
MPTLLKLRVFLDVYILFVVIDPILLELSQCQTSMMLVGASSSRLDYPSDEGEVVVWCTKTGHGTRLIPLGALQGAQLLQTSVYIQIAGFINQAQVNIAPDDLGPHGSDKRDNPIGGLMYSNTFQQAIEWIKYVPIKRCGASHTSSPICDADVKTPVEIYTNQDGYMLRWTHWPMEGTPSGVFEWCHLYMPTITPAPSQTGGSYYF